MISISPVKYKKPAPPAEPPPDPVDFRMAWNFRNAGFIHHFILASNPPNFAFELAFQNLVVDGATHITTPISITVPAGMYNMPAFPNTSKMCAYSGFVLDTYGVALKAALQTAIPSLTAVKLYLPLSTFNGASSNSIYLYVEGATKTITSIEARVVDGKSPFGSGSVSTPFQTVGLIDNQNHSVIC